MKGMKMSSKSNDYEGKREFARKAFEFTSYILDLDKRAEKSRLSWKVAFINEQVEELKKLLALESPTHEQIDKMFLYSLSVCSFATKQSTRMHIEIMEGNYRPKEDK